MRATPSFSRFASTIARAPSSSVMCFVSSRAPSAMPTRSAPSSRALSFISTAVSSLLNISTELFLPFLEILQLLRHHALVTLRPDPARIPLREATARLACFAGLLPFFLRGDFFRRALGDHLLHFREVRVIVVADRAYREAAGAIAE